VFISKSEAILQATIDVVAKQASASELTLFHLFGNKKGLLQQ
jgi:hypothetical protein